MALTINKLLIANRGEIACRIIRTCKKLGITTVAVYSEPDNDALFVQLADEAYLLGKAAAAESYLNMEKIIAVCKRAGADAVHPGYGFLSENGEFAQRCEAAGVAFVGPRAETMALLGDKISVKDLLMTKTHDVPLVPGYNGVDQSLGKLEIEAKRIGVPLLVKASAGGGGKGMRVVHAVKDIKEVIAAVKREALSSFGSDKLLLERYFVSCKHVEIQIFGDKHGNIITLGERDCSVQRRFQKVIEETPSPILTEAVRNAMCASAIAIGHLSNYVGAGTVEFLVEPSSLKYYFLEVNTRLQVEHPITELVYGVDLVEWQIEVARGKKISELCLKDGRPSDQLARRGHAVEARLYAEDPNNNFFPCTGTLTCFEPLDVEGLRYDSGVQSGSVISVDYDPMIAKVISFGLTRDLAVQRMIKALNGTVVAGVVNNGAFMVDVLNDDDFRRGDYDTGFIEAHFPAAVRHTRAQLSEASSTEVATVALLWEALGRQSSRRTLKNIPAGFTNGPRRNNSATYQIKKGPRVVLHYQLDRSMAPAGVHQALLSMQVARKPEDGPDAASAMAFLLEAKPRARGAELTCIVGGARRKYRVVAGEEGDLMVHRAGLGCHRLTKESLVGGGSSKAGDAGPEVLAPMPCKVVQILVNVGDDVRAGQQVAVLESMKMEMKIVAALGGKVGVVNVKAGQVVKEGTTLLVVTPAAKL